MRYDLAALAGEAPKDATLVVYHTAVLAYVAAVADREKFAREARSLCDYWISNEFHAVFPDIARRTNTQGPRNRFLLAVNGDPMAWTDPHGASMEWIGAQIPHSNRS